MSEEPTKTEGISPARAGEGVRQLIRRAKQATRRKFPAEEKIRILLEGMRAEISVVELCRREGIHPTIYYKWLKDFMEAGKGRAVPRKPMRCYSQTKLQKLPLLVRLG